MGTRRGIHQGLQVVGETIQEAWLPLRRVDDSNRAVGCAIVGGCAWVTSTRVIAEYMGLKIAGAIEECIASGYPFNGMEVQTMPGDAHTVQMLAVEADPLAVVDFTCEFDPLAVIASAANRVAELEYVRHRLQVPIPALPPSTPPHLTVVRP